jgi:polyphosphate kinase
MSTVTAQRASKKSRQAAQVDGERAPIVESNGIARTPDIRTAPNQPMLSAELFINRELSWLDFNARVLAEARDPSVPLLERAKFIAIFSSNLDEFFMIRVAGVLRKVSAGVTEPSVDGRTATALYLAIRERTRRLQYEQTSIFLKHLLPELRRSGVEITTYADISDEERASLSEYFRREVFPVLTPQAIDHARRFPHISNDSMSLIVLLRSGGADKLARVKLPKVLPRLVRIPEPADPNRIRIVWLEDLISAHLHELFPGHQAIEAYPFHLTRDSDIEIDDDEDARDLLATMRELLSERTFGSVVRLMVDTRMPATVVNWLLAQLGATERELYVTEGPLALEDMIELLRLDRPDLKDPPFIPSTLGGNPDNGTWGVPDIFATIRERDVLVYHPYQSFAIFTDFLKAASTDPDVVAIKQTLYRIGKDSPLIPSLIEARDDDTQVAVLVELKARFDEENNISWAQQLEHHGVHVAYGIAGLKTHCKVTLVVRREADGLRRYAHLSTGNYNAGTARLYEDIGLFTSDAEITSDVSELFNVLTGYSEQDTYRKIWVAPRSLRDHFLSGIEREIRAHREHGNGRLIFKMNSLVDRELIRALYAASEAGVQIDLIVRGACCLRPGVKRWSENIRVRSVIGRFLEHSRLYYFGNGGNDEIYLGSADMMERNLDRRIEVVFPVEDPRLVAYLRDTVLPLYFSDIENSWTLGQDGAWTMLRTFGVDSHQDVQTELMHLYSRSNLSAPLLTQ